MLPIAPLVRPAVLNGMKNGRLPDHILFTVAPLSGGVAARLVGAAARGWAAMQQAALNDGHQLKIGYATNAYRPYADQERIFRDRYYVSSLGTTRWLGQRWRKRSGVAAAAVPGTSNHGWGLAIDLGEERDGDPGTESLDAGTLQWLIDNAHRFGFSAELQSEPWHWRYVAGDNIPAEVLDYEKKGNSTMHMIKLPNGLYRVYWGHRNYTDVSSPDHWKEVILKGQQTGVFESPYMNVLMDGSRYIDEFDDLPGEIGPGQVDVDVDYGRIARETANHLAARLKS